MSDNENNVLRESNVGICKDSSRLPWALILPPSLTEKETQATKDGQIRLLLGEKKPASPANPGRDILQEHASVTSQIKVFMEDVASCYTISIVYHIPVITVY